MSRVLVVGGNGFIGSHVALQAAEKGYELRLLLRRAPRPELRGLGAQVFRGDVRNEADLTPFLEGADALLHVAGVNTPSSAQRENIVQAEQAIRETRAQLEANRKALGHIREQIKISDQLLAEGLTPRTKHLAILREE